MEEYALALFRAANDLSLAIANNDAKEAKALLDRHPALACGRSGPSHDFIRIHTPIFSAIRKESLDVLKVLLTARPNLVNVSILCDGKEVTPLTWSCNRFSVSYHYMYDGKKVPPHFLQVLLQHGANPRVTSLGKWSHGTPLHHLCDAARDVKTDIFQKKQPGKAQDPYVVICIQQYIQGLVVSSLDDVTTCFTTFSTPRSIQDHACTVLDITWPSNLMVADWLREECYFAITENQHTYGQGRSKRKSLPKNDKPSNITTDHLVKVRRLLVKGYAHALVKRQQHSGRQRDLSAVLSQISDSIAKEPQWDKRDDGSFGFYQLESGKHTLAEIQALLAYIIAFSFTSAVVASPESDSDNDSNSDSDSNRGLHNNCHAVLCEHLPVQSQPSPLVMQQQKAVQEALQRPWLVAGTLKLELDVVYVLVRNFAGTVKLTTQK